LSRFLRETSRLEWLRLGEASRMLGVAPQTLRRWSDAGRISVLTTPGGHRRYARASLERMLPRDQSARPPLLRSGMTISRLARAYRTEARSAAQRLPWVGELSETQREWFRTHGRQLAELLVLHLDAPDRESAQESLRRASEDAASYGRMAAELGVSLSQAVEGFLQFRRPFLHQLAVFAESRGLDAAATADMIGAADNAMDRLLLSAMTGHGVDRARKARRRALGQ
jgi:DNA-binding transcriptional MerR regulator